MAHYSQMLMNVQESIISAAQALIREIETCEKIVESSRDHVSGEEMYSEEQCQAANADAGVLLFAHCLCHCLHTHLPAQEI